MPTKQEILKVKAECEANAQEIVDICENYKMGFIHASELHNQLKGLIVYFEEYIKTSCQDHKNVAYLLKHYEENHINE